MRRIAFASLMLTLGATAAAAADLPAPNYKAPPPVPVASRWTGCYIAGGFGYGMYNADATEVQSATGQFYKDEGTSGGRGWIGQAQVGCDYQFSAIGGNWVVGAFGDYNFQGLTGNHIGDDETIIGVGKLKQSSAWSVGGRAGYLISPNFLSYLSIGYTQTRFDQVNYYSVFAPGTPTNESLPATTFQGWYLGSGFEYSISYFPGLNLKTEYRFSEFNSKVVNLFNTSTGSPLPTAESIKPYTQSIVTSLVYRFNWGGAIR